MSISVNFGWAWNYGTMDLKSMYVSPGEFYFANSFKNYGSLLVSGYLAGMGSNVYLGHLVNFGTVDIEQCNLNMSGLTNNGTFIAQDVISESPVNLSVNNQGIFRLLQSNYESKAILWQGSISNDSICELTGIFAGRLSIYNNDSLFVKGFYNDDNLMLGSRRNGLRFINYGRMGLQSDRSLTSGSYAILDSSANYGVLYSIGRHWFRDFYNKGTIEQKGATLFSGLKNDGELKVFGKQQIFGLQNTGHYFSYYDPLYSNLPGYW
jgi:hypothetical protein